MMTGTYQLRWRGDNLQKKIPKLKINLVAELEQNAIARMEIASV
jgi:hypothetical protein